MTIGERIKARRKELNLSQTELASRLGYKTKVAISNVENDKEDLTSTRIRKFAQALDCTPAYLMGWEETKNPEFAPDNAVTLAKVAKDLDMMDALKVYLSLPDDKKKYIITLIKSFPTTP